MNNPKPVQKPHPPITVGGSGEKVMLKLVAKYADRWNCPAGYDSFERKFNVLKDHCKKVGRNLDEINISEQLLVCIGDNDAEVEQKWKMAPSMKPFSITGIKGTPSQLIEQLKNRVKMGITTFTVFFSDFAPPPTLELFASVEPVIEVSDRLGHFLAAAALEAVRIDHDDIVKILDACLELGRSGRASVRVAHRPEQSPRCRARGSAAGSAGNQTPPSGRAARSSLGHPAGADAGKLDLGRDCLTHPHRPEPETRESQPGGRCHA